MTQSYKPGPPDWSKPLVAVHEYGRVVPATARKIDESSMPYSVKFDPYESLFARVNGEISGTPYTIHNAADPAEQPDPALYERMVALVREVADQRAVPGTMLQLYNRAGAIVAELPEPPVDADLLEARKCVMQFNGQSPYTDHGDDDDKQSVKAALAAIKRGRELEREGK